MLEDHGAAGSAAGYLFQLERAVVRLSEPGHGKLVGVETLDDIAEITDWGVALEQDKHAIGNRGTYTDRSQDLWKTLSTWVAAVSNGEVDPGSTDFICVTNKVLGPGTLIRDIAGARSPQQVANAIERIRSTSASLPAAMHHFRDVIAEAEDGELGAVISRLRLIDGSDNEMLPSEIQRRVCQHVYLIEAPHDEVFQALVGWVHSQCMQRWRARKPAWIPWEAFASHVNRLRSLYSNALVLRAAADVPIDVNAESFEEDRLFLRQLRLLNLDDTDLLSDAVADFLRARTEMVRISQDGHITKSDHSDFLDRLRRRWINFHRRHKSGLDVADSEYARRACSAGTAVLTDCMAVKEPLAGSPVEQHYFICGHYHHLADLLAIGWHPDFKTFLASEE